MASKPTNSRRRSATKVERRREAFREWLLLLAEGGDLTTDEQFHAKATSLQSKKIGETWRQVCNSTRSRNGADSPRLGMDWQWLAPPL